MTDDRPNQRPDGSSQRGPTLKHAQPDTDGEQLPEPGAPGSVTAAMRDEPDHGEDSYQGHGRLQDQVAIVTGGDSGIGRAVALMFAREGADIVVCYLEGEEEDG